MVTLDVTVPGWTEYRTRRPRSYVAQYVHAIREAVPRWLSITLGENVIVEAETQNQLPPDEDIAALLRTLDALRPPVRELLASEPRPPDYVIKIGRTNIMIEMRLRDRVAYLEIQNADYAVMGAVLEETVELMRVVRDAYASRQR